MHAYLDFIFQPILPHWTPHPYSEPQLLSTCMSKKAEQLAWGQFMIIWILQNPKKCIIFFSLHDNSKVSEHYFNKINLLVIDRYNGVPSQIMVSTSYHSLESSLLKQKLSQRHRFYYMKITKHGKNMRLVNNIKK